MNLHVGDGAHAEEQPKKLARDALSRSASRKFYTAIAEQKRLNKRVSPKRLPPKKKEDIRSIQEELLYGIVQRFRGGLVVKAHRLWYLSTLGLRVKKKKDLHVGDGAHEEEQPKKLARDALSRSAIRKFYTRSAVPKRRNKRVFPQPPLPVKKSWHELACGNEAGSYLRLKDSCITQLEAQGPSRTCNKSKEEREKPACGRWCP